ncbi:alpha/beta hydrolase family protein [Nocardia vulneris]|uniref:alpha/beta hydrolase family protein n=1 Tax=Nocardia vulneris TaxID=1141657 RepID=UPI000A63D9D9|nr:acyl-CoA thioester hydrolase/BAAT C-terminal domain-containing protein [Nocardia vulneris]
MQSALIVRLKRIAPTIRKPLIRRVTPAAFLVLACVAVSAGAASAAPADDPPIREDVTFDSHGVTLRGTVFVPPAAADTRRTAIVLVHGAGPGPRDKYRPEAEAFARAGIVTLAFDKRTAGYSLAERDFGLLADDVLAGLAVVRARADVDPARTGLWALSEGAWVAPLAASRSPDVAFLVTIGGSAFDPLRTQTWNLGNQLRHQGISGGLAEAIAAPGAQLMAATGLFPEAGHEPAPVLERLRLPVLALWGAHDTVTPPAESAVVFQQALARAGNQHVTIRFVPNAGHTGHRSTDGFDKVGGQLFDGKPLGALDPGYTDVMTSWVWSVARGAAPLSSAEPVPPQVDTSREPSSGAWYDTAVVRYGALALLLVGFLGYPVLAWAGRRRAPDGRAVRAPARWLSATGLFAVIGTLTYVVSCFATGVQGASAFLAGRTLPWLVLQTFSAVALFSLIATVLVWWRTRRRVVGVERVRLALLVLAGIVFVPWALSWGLYSL